MTTTITGPAEVLAVDVEDADGTPLTQLNASASFEVWDQPLNVRVIGPIAMLWSAPVNGWTTVFDPTSLASATYEAKVTVTPAVGLPVTKWVEYAYVPHADPGNPATRPSSSAHYLQPWCDESDLPRRRLLDSNGVELSDISLGWMIAAATDILYVLSGRKYRSGRSVVRPTSIQMASGPPLLYPYSSMSGYGSAWGFATGWVWSAIGMGFWFSQDLNEVLLQGPVTKINSVIVDGVTLPSTAYTLYERRRLVRNVDANGGASAPIWPWRQSLSLPITEQGTFQIDYEWGNPVKDSGRLACAELAIELALSFSGQDPCRLPARVQHVATQGVDAAVGDALEFLKEDLTGLPICDMFLRAENPHRRRRRSVFLGPNSTLNRSA